MSKSKASQISIRQCFADLADPRREHLRLHSLWDIVALTICAVVSGADSWVDVANYGHEKYDMLETFLELENGIPAHDTIGRVFSLLDPTSFQVGFSKWVNALVEATQGRLVAIDGKTLRHSFDTKRGKSALHLISAWATENHLMLGQKAVDCKSNEITAIPELLRILDLTGAIVTIDAMGCQKEIAADIQEAGAHYVLALKENHETLYKDVCQLFIDGLENDFADIEHHSCQTIEKGHGRKETRHYHIVPVPEELTERHPQWQGLRTLGMVFSERQVGDAEPTGETRFFISSLPPKVKTFARAVRGHWGIENSLHWVLDVSFREDDSRLRKDHGPENLALLRRLAASLLKNETTTKAGVACKRKKAGWNDGYLVRVLGASLS
jgi:predicted transposase YbfD/YdcC